MALRIKNKKGMKSKLLSFVLSVGLTVSVVACGDQSTDRLKSSTEQVHSIFDDYHDFKLAINPIEATKGGANDYNGYLVNYISDENQSSLKKDYTAFLSRARSIDLTSLSSEDQISLKALEWDARIKLEGLNNKLVTIASPLFDLPNFELLPMSQIASLHLYIGQLAGGTSIQPFDSVQDYVNWLSRVDQYLIWLDTAEQKMKEGIQEGVVLPKILIERVISQLEPFANTPKDEHIFYAPIKMLPDSISAENSDLLSSAYSTMVEDKIIPRYTSLLTFFKDEYLPEGRATDGLLNLPNGRETYDYLIRLHTSTDMTAEEIHALGISEVARIKKEMISIKDELGFEGDFLSFLGSVRTRPELSSFKNPEEVIANFEAIHEKLKPGVSKLFDLSPKAGFEIRRTEAFREKSAAAEYVPGSKDGTRPGVFYVPIPDVASYNMVSDEALFLHEAIPGHHYQLSLQQENQNLPEFLHAEGMGVFVEGWALYSESLGKELGLYDDPYQYFGMLSMEMHRAIRLVVDSGIHALGWSREDAIKYSLEHEAESEANITSEIERYMATPGQALSYKIGQLKIRELRTRAEAAFGDEFDVREFHNQVLGSGSLPMALLEEKIDAWIEGK